MLFKEIVPVYSVDRKKAINTLYGQNAELLNVKAGGTYSTLQSYRLSHMFSDQAILLLTQNASYFLIATVREDCVI
jgi:hypothetical protein